MIGAGGGNTLMSLLVSLGVDAKDLNQGLDKAESKSKSTGSSIAKGLGGAIATGVAGAVAVVGTATAAIASTIGPASDLSETMSKVNVVFGDSAEEVLAFGETAAEALGMTQNQALAAAGTYGNLFRAMGISTDASTEMSTGLVTLAADLASFNNMNPEDVLNALRSGLSGETEPLKRLGVNLNQAGVEAKAMAMGLYDGEGAITASAKAQATYALVMEQTSLAQGDFERTSKGLANQQRILAANFGDIKATIGQAFLPYIEQGVQMLNEFAGGLKEVLGSSMPLEEKMGAIGEMAGSLASKILEMLPTLTAAAVGLATGLAQGLITAIPAMMPMMIQLMLGLVNTIIELAPMMLDAAFQIIFQLAMGIADALPKMIPALVDMLLNMVNILIENAPLMIDAAIAIIIGLIDGIINALPIIIEQLPVIVDAIISAIIVALPKLIEAALKIINMLVKGIVQYLPVLMKTAGDLVVKIVQAIIKLVPQLWDAGKQLIAGLWEGIKSMFGLVIDGIKNFGKTILDGLDDIFNFGSPSKTMFELGKLMMLGLEKGIDQYAVMPDLSLQGTVTGSKPVASANYGDVTFNSPTANEIGKAVVQHMMQAGAIG